MTLSDFVVPTYVQMLGALPQWLSKAEAQVLQNSGRGCLTVKA